MFLLDFFNFLFVVFMEVFHSFNILCDCNFLTVNSILMLSVEISFLSKLFPSGFGLISNNIGFLQFNFHCFDFGSQFGIFVVHVSYQTYLNIMECPLLLKFMPFLLENVESLGHFELLHKVSNEVINNNISAQCFRDRFSHSSSSG